MRIYALLALIVGLSIAAAAPERKVVQTDLEKLQGTWQAVAAEMDGKAVSPEAVKSLKLVIKCDRLFLTGFDRARIAEEVTFTFDPSQTPKTIDLQDLLLDVPANFGIYSVEGDTLKLCVDKDGRHRPEEFTSKKGKSLLTFQRVQDDARPIVMSAEKETHRTPTRRRHDLAIALIGGLTSAKAEFAQPREYREPFRGFGPGMSGPEAQLIAQYWVRSYLRRPARADEVRYWADQLLRRPAGETLSALLANQEYYDYAGGTPGAYIRQLIEDVGHHHATRFEIQDRLRTTADLRPRGIAGRFLAEYPGNWWPGPAATPPLELERFYRGDDWH
jgi:uncharacterized protein (TIGR03067 family)